MCACASALALAIDQWHGAPALAKIANVRTVGGIVFPGSPLAATKEELQQIAGFWPDIEKSRAEAKRLLKEAGAEGLKFELLNRNVDQPYKYVGTWVIDEWKQDRPQGRRRRCVPTGPWFSEACAPATSTSRWRPTARASSIRCSIPASTCRTRSIPENYGDYDDDKSIELYEKMQHETDPAKAAGGDARLRDVHARHAGARDRAAVLVPHHPRPVVRQGLEDQPESG